MNDEHISHRMGTNEPPPIRGQHPQQVLGVDAEQLKEMYRAVSDELASVRVTAEQARALRTLNEKLKEESMRFRARAEAAEEIVDRMLSAILDKVNA